MPKCVEITPRHGCSPVNLQHIFRTSFPKNTPGRLLLLLLIVLNFMFLKHMKDLLRFHVVDP